MFLIFLRLASTLWHDDVTLFTCSVHLMSLLSQVPNNLNFSTLSTVWSFKVRGGVLVSVRLDRSLWEFRDAAPLCRQRKQEEPSCKQSCISFA